MEIKSNKCHLINSDISDTSSPNFDISDLYSNISSVMSLSHLVRWHSSAFNYWSPMDFEIGLWKHGINGSGEWNTFFYGICARLFMK